MNNSASKINAFIQALEQAFEKMVNDAETPEEKAPFNDKTKKVTLELYKNILHSSGDIMNMPVVQETLDYFSDKIGKDFSDKLGPLLVLIITHSTFNGITAYDNLLKDQFIERDKNLCEAISNLSAITKGHDMAIEQIRDKIGASFK